MVGEIICVGTELLLGDIVNTNAAFLSAQLSELGINLYNQTVIGDNSQRLAKSVSSALKNCDIIILTGGLGPTSDDITKETVAELLGLKLIQDKKVLLDIENYYAKQSRAIPSGVLKQALVPEGATVLKNDFGTAPGLLLQADGKKIILLPGPPREMQPMFQNVVKPILRAESDSIITTKNFYVYGMGESEVANAIGEKLLGGSNPTVATYAKDGVVQVRVTASGKNETETNFKLNSVTTEISNILGDAIYSQDKLGLQNVAVELLLEKGLKVATAESCTAGMLSKSITEVSGSSNVFEMGVSAYANDIKIRVLKVPKETIALRGAVSSETAALMAKGVREAANADIGIGITGVAGPEPSENKPVGLVYIALADKANVWVRKINAAYGNDRERVRNAATLAALDLIRRYAISSPTILGNGVSLGDKLLICSNASDFIIPDEAKIIKKVDEPKQFKAPVPIMEFNNSNTDELVELLLNDEEPLLEDVLPTDNIITTEESFNYIADIGDEQEEKDTKQPNAFTKFLKHLLPWKNDPAKEIIRKLIFLIALITFVATGIYLIGYFGQGRENEGMVNDAREIYNAADDSVNNKGMLVRFEALYNKNSDICGWLSIDGTKIDYPVYQTKDNDFYVTHDMNKQESRYGAVFADSNALLKKDKRSQNIVLYGHNMIDGSMFGGILDYTKLSFYKTNPLINFDTLYSTNTYKVFAVIITNSKKQDDNGYIFNYMKHTFSSENNFLIWAENVKARSIINTGVDIKGTDEIIALSTCSYEFDDARTVVFARKVREGESLHVNTKASKYNPSPLYPQAYYDKNGGKKPDIKIEIPTDEAQQEDNEKIESEEENKKGTSSKDKEVLSILENSNIDEEILEDAHLPEDLPTVTVSNYVGMELQDAIKKISEQGLYISNVEYDDSDEETNIVLVQSIAEDIQIDGGSGISLLVSGKPLKISVPDFVGLSLNEAKEKANEAGMTLNVMTLPSKEKENTVLIQSIDPNTETQEHSVLIFISNGKNEVPDVVGLTTKEAKETLTASGFKVEVVEEETDDETLVGVVFEQSNKPYELSNTDETLVIYVGIESKNESNSNESSKESNSSKTTNSKTNSSKVTSSKSTSSKETSSKVTSSKSTSSKETSSKVTSSKATSSKETSSKVTSSKTTSSKETSSKVTSSKTTSSKETSSKVTSSKVTSSKESSSSEVTDTTEKPSSESSTESKTPESNRVNENSNDDGEPIAQE